MTRSRNVVILKSQLNPVSWMLISQSQIHYRKASPYS